MASYLRTLAFELRKRGASEEQVASKVAEVSLVKDPESQFGPAATVAETVPEGSHRSLGAWVVRGGIVVMVASIAWFLWVQIVQGRPVSILSLLLPTAVLVLSVAAGAAIDHRLPNSPEASAESAEIDN